MSGLEENRIRELVIAAGIDVHRPLRPGLAEPFDEMVLAYKQQKRGLTECDALSVSLVPASIVRSTSASRVSLRSPPEPPVFSFGGFLGKPGEQVAKLAVLAVAQGLDQKR